MKAIWGEGRIVPLVLLGKLVVCLLFSSEHASAARESPQVLVEERLSACTWIVKSEALGVPWGVSNVYAAPVPCAAYTVLT